MKNDLSSLFAEHISDKFSLYKKLLVSHGYDHLLIAASNPLTPFRDDEALVQWVDAIAVHACGAENITRDAFSAMRAEK